MKNILIAIRSIFKKGRHNVMKIVSLGIGLAVGLVLIAKVYFEQSYDDFYPDRDRVYQVWAKYQQNGGELKDYPQTSGGIAPTMQQQIPEIETVTRSSPRRWLSSAAAASISSSFCWNLAAS